MMGFDIKEYVDKVAQTKYLASSEKNALEFIITNLDIEEKLNIKTISEECYISSSAIMRLSKKMGFSGFTEMIYSLKTKLESEEMRQDDFLDNIYTMSSEHRYIFKQLFKQKNKVITIFANGFSEIIGEYIYKKLMILGFDCLYIGGGDSYSIFENRLERTDVVIPISKSGETDGIIYRSQRAKEKNIKIISITGNSRSSLSSISTASIIVNDLKPTDTSNSQVNPYYGYAILAFESLLSEIIEY